MWWMIVDRTNIVKLSFHLSILSTLLDQLEVPVCAILRPLFDLFQTASQPRVEGSHGPWSRYTFQLRDFTAWVYRSIRLM